jgi:hypothetical protein
MDFPQLAAWLLRGIYPRYPEDHPLILSRPKHWRLIADRLSRIPEVWEAHAERLELLRLLARLSGEA